MSFVLDHVRRVDAQLDRLYHNYSYSLETLFHRSSDCERHLLPGSSSSSLTKSTDSNTRVKDSITGERRRYDDGREDPTSTIVTNEEATQTLDEELASRIRKLQALVKVLGVDSATSSILPGDGTSRSKTATVSGLLSPRQLGLGLSRARLSDRMCRACKRQQQQSQTQFQGQKPEQKRQSQEGKHVRSDEQSYKTTVNERMSVYEHELEWLMLSKVTAQTYGQVLSTILELTIPLSEDMWYWDDVFGSYTYSIFYLIQMSPVWGWQWVRGIYADVKARKGHLRETRNGGGRGNLIEVLHLVRQVLGEKMDTVGLTLRKSVSSIFPIASASIQSPMARIRTEAKAKEAALRRFRILNANALGVLVGEALNQDCSAIDSSQQSLAISPTAETVAALEQQRQKFKRTVAKSVALMDAVLLKVSDTNVMLENFDDAIAACTNEDEFYINASTDDDGVNNISDDDAIDKGSALRPALVAERLQKLLDERLPLYIECFERITGESGKPSRAVRYWPVAATLLLSSSTVLRIFFNRKERILTWIREFGATTIDFWHNWIVTPVQNVIKTIRHNEGSELSLLGKQSLEGDRASLERMVVDFALDNPEIAGLKDDPAAIAAIRHKVREGDVTPVLRAYEQDLKRPVVGAMTGNLVRTLLIQIQKTKVDVEVAVGGIDALLKSQELVFGFIGLTPGIMVCFGLWRWLKNAVGSRKVLKQGMRHNQLLRMVRNIDRILSAATPTDFGELYYKDQGLLLCEIHVLRQSAKAIIPTRIYREFLEDVDELVDVRSGLQRQEKAVHRVRWAYARWIT